MKNAERSFGNLIYSARWLMAPLHLGLCLVLVAISLKFFQSMFFLTANIFVIGEKDLILAVLGIIDLVLVAGLSLMVMLSGYENFVSRFASAGREKELAWLGKLDMDKLKAKLASSIIAISSIHLLKVFMDIEKIPNDKVMLYALLHFIFVTSAVGLAVISRVSQKKAAG